MQQRFRAPAAAAVAFVLLVPALGLAQENELRKPVKAPVRMEIREMAPAPAHAPAAAPAPAPAPAPVPVPAPVPAKEIRPSKFPNIDTARNRTDYDMSTPKADGIRLGRDEDTGDTVLGSTPPKKTKQGDSFEAQPIQVRPIVRGAGS